MNIMTSSGKKAPINFDTQNVIDTVIKLVVLGILIGWCFQILRPFIIIILWAVMIAITLYPAYRLLKEKTGGRSKIAAGLITIILLAILIVPSIFLADSLIVGIKDFSSSLDKGTLGIPQPPEHIQGWPLIGDSFYTFWQSAYDNFEGLMLKYNSELIDVAQWLLGALVGTGKGLLQILASIILAGFLLLGSENSSKRMAGLYTKIAGERGPEFFHTTEITIRNVAKGVLGVAIIQSLLLGIIFVIAGIPYAGLWALLCLFLAIIQLGPILVTLPVVIYMFVQFDPWMAILFTIFIVIASLLDNVLKPLMMGKGATVPMLVIFLGSIGGFIASGFIGLFIGAIVLSLGYKLYTGWLKD